MKKTLLPSRFVVASAIFTTLSFFPLVPSFAKDVRWFNGQLAPEPSGSLLTNNAGYWGKMTPTGITYSYPVAPTNPPDAPSANQAGNGNRLLDGQAAGDWNSPVGVDFKPLVVDFDFHQTVALKHVAAAQYNSRDLKLAQVEVKTEVDNEWKNVYSTASSSGILHHMVLPEAVPARYVRLTLQSTGNITWISQIWMWGEATPVTTNNLNGFLPEMQNFPETKDAQPGDATILSTDELAKWREVTGHQADGITWQPAPTWQMLAKDPLKGNFLPGKEALRQPVRMKVARREGESTAVFLVNASDKAKDVTVRLDDFKDKDGKSVASIQKELYVAGAIWTRRWGQTLRPLFSAKNKIDGALMEKYLTNGSVIKDFPTLHLPPRGTAMLWLTVSTQNTAPGTYSTVLSDGDNQIPVQVEVTPVALPMPDVWMRFWGNAPAGSQNLWSSDDAIRRELQYQQEMGATVYDHWPAEGSDVKIAQNIARQSGRRIYIVKGISSANIRDAGYLSKLDASNLGEAIEKEVREDTLRMIQNARESGLSYEDWSVELWDEPNVTNMASWAAVARIIKATDPQVRIYMNPLFWIEGTGFAPDERQVQVLGEWYNQLVDISVPIMGQTDATKYPEANRKFYNHLPRAVRAQFIHPNPGRMISWEAFIRDYNGWGSYAYYAPRKDAWNDFDHSEFDYQIVYPGPEGFVPTIESESMRESWEDYRLLSLLKQQGKTRELSNILNIYKGGVIAVPTNETPADRDDRSMKAGKNLSNLREMMMDYLAP